jgi:hypothetical protein
MAMLGRANSAAARLRWNSVLWTALLLLAACRDAFAQDPKPLQTEELPPDAPQVVEVVHQLAYPLRHFLLAELSGTYLYGDKFLETVGTDLDLRYFFQEKWALGIGGGVYTSSQVSEAGGLLQEGNPPLLYNPKYMVRLVGSVYPVYGKLAFGDSIVRFRLLAELGPHVAGLRAVGANAILGNPDDTRWRWGPYGAIGSWFALSNSVSLQLKAAVAVEAPFLSDTWRKVWAISAGLGGRLHL